MTYTSKTLFISSIQNTCCIISRTNKVVLPFVSYIFGLQAGIFCKCTLLTQAPNLKCSNVKGQVYCVNRELRFLVNEWYSWRLTGKFTGRKWRAFNYSTSNCQVYFETSGCAIQHKWFSLMVFNIDAQLNRSVR